MAVAMFMRLHGLSPGQYDRLIASLQLDISPSAGQIVHVAAEGADCIEACDVWQTRETAEAFVTGMLEPQCAALGLRARVEYEILPLHNLFAPDLDTIERIGAVSLPAFAGGSIFR